MSLYANFVGLTITQITLSVYKLTGESQVSTGSQLKSRFFSDSPNNATFAFPPWNMLFLVRFVPQIKLPIHVLDLCCWC